MIDNGLDRLWIISPHTYVIFVKFTQPLLIDFWITSWTPGFSAASISRWCNVCIIAVEIINLSSEPCALQWRGWLAQPWWTWWFISAWDYMHIWFINFDSAAFWLGCVRMSQRFIKKNLRTVSHALTNGRPTTLFACWPRSVSSWWEMRRRERLCTRPYKTFGLTTPCWRLTQRPWLNGG